MVWLFVICALGIGLIALLLFLTGSIFAGLNAVQPVALHSPLRANYGMDKLSFVVPALDFGVVEEALRDQATSTAGVEATVTAIAGSLETAVPTITPRFTGANPTAAASPTNKPAATALPPATRTPVPTGTQAPSPTFTLTAVDTFTPTSTLWSSFTPTRRPGTITPTKIPARTLTPTRTKNVNPTAGNTATATATQPKPPTPTPTRRPTNTPMPPTIAPTNTKPAYPPPATVAPTGYP